MKSCTLDGAQLPDAAAAYKELAAAFDAPAYFGANPDALWDVITEYSGAPVEIVWRHSAQSAALLGPAFEQIVAVLERAATDGLLKFELR
jgi:RNAse (barnase) inhibitor barstar